MQARRTKVDPRILKAKPGFGRVAQLGQIPGVTPDDVKDISAEIAHLHAMLLDTPGGAEESARIWKAFSGVQSAGAIFEAVSVLGNEVVKASKATVTAVESIRADAESGFFSWFGSNDLRAQALQNWNTLIGNTGRFIGATLDELPALKLFILQRRVESVRETGQADFTIGPDTALAREAHRQVVRLSFGTRRIRQGIAIVGDQFVKAAKPDFLGLIGDFFKGLLAFIDQLLKVVARTVEQLAVSVGKAAGIVVKGAAGGIAEALGGVPVWLWGAAGVAALGGAGYLMIKYGTPVRMMRAARED